MVYICIQNDIRIILVPNLLLLKVNLFSSYRVKRTTSCRYFRLITSVILVPRFPSKSNGSQFTGIRDIAPCARARGRNQYKYVAARPQRIKPLTP